jgi:hypothetical protein
LDGPRRGRRYPALIRDPWIAGQARNDNYRMGCHPEIDLKLTRDP